MIGAAMFKRYAIIGAVVLIVVLLFYRHSTTGPSEPAIQNNDLESLNRKPEELDAALKESGYQHLEQQTAPASQMLNLETTPVNIETTKKHQLWNSKQRSSLKQIFLKESNPKKMIKDSSKIISKAKVKSLTNIRNSSTTTTLPPQPELPQANLQVRPTTHTKEQQNPSLEPKIGITRNQDGFHFLDTFVNGAAITFKPVNVTDAFKEDKYFKTEKQFTIDKLVSFFPHNRICSNSDGSTYENWLAMEFPPNSNWDQTYKTPCYTDYMTAKFRCIPHIYMVGWGKSGTTDMWWYWKRHPELVLGYKETQFLSQFSFWENHKNMKTFDELLIYFFDNRTTTIQKGHPEKIMYDATATIIYDNWHWRIKQGYQGDPDVPTHTNFHYLRKIHPGAQIVVMMRNPTTRALSFYNHGVDMTKNHNANLRFEYKDMPHSPVDIHKFFIDSIYYFNDCVRKKSLRACCHMSGWESQNWGDPKYFMTLRIGIYYIYLEEVFKNYPRNQVHLVKSEDFYKTPYETLNDLFSFFNISLSHTQHMVREKGSYILMKIPRYFKPLVETYKLLQQFYAPFNRRLVTMLDEHRWSQWETELDELINKHITVLQPLKKENGGQAGGF